GVAQEVARGIGGEEVRTPGPEALLQQVVEDQHERDQCDHGAPQQQAAHEPVGVAPPGADRGEAGAHTPTAAGAGASAVARLPRTPRLTTQRARPLTNSVSTNNSRPASIRAARWIGTFAA